MQMRIGSYNVEYFDKLFEEDNNLKESADEKKRLEAIRDVLKKIDCDIMGIVEAPRTDKNGTQNTVKCLENFAGWAELRTKSALTGFTSAGKQEIALLYDSEKVSVEHKPRSSKSNPSFDGTFFFDTDDDRIKETYKFYRPPLEALVEVSGTDKAFYMIVVHTKSKGVFNVVDMVHWERESNRNRRKLIAECTWIRKRVNQLLKDGFDIVVLGDVNDGPGMDYYEHQLGRSAVEIIMGNLFEPDLILRNHIGRPKWEDHGWKPSSARFKDRMTEDIVNVLIDHILVSRNIKVNDSTCHRIWNPYENKQLEPISDSLELASDHFPVTLDIEL